MRSVSDAARTAVDGLGILFEADTLLIEAPAMRSILLGIQAASACNCLDTLYRETELELLGDAVCINGADYYRVEPIGPKFRGEKVITAAMLRGAGLLDSRTLH